MRRQFGVLAAACLAACTLAACATPSGAPAMTFERSAAVLREGHAQVCAIVRDRHAAGRLTGEPFNRARDLCLQADEALDAAQAAWTLGKETDARQLAAKAAELVDAVRALTAGQ